MSDKKKGNPSQQGKDRLRSLLFEQWQAFGTTLDKYQWPMESARWHELVFCLIAKLGQPQFDNSRARRITNILADLNLLEINALAGLCDENQEPVLTHTDTILMLGLLERAGLSSAQSQSIVTTLCQAALALTKKHGGRVQRYLRYYGQQMLNDLSNQFSFSDIDSDKLKHVFTHWLQNVLNMPIELAEPEVQHLCGELGVSIDELIDVADELDLNLALIDDMVASSITSSFSSEVADLSEH